MLRTGLLVREVEVLLALLDGLLVLIEQQERFNKLGIAKGFSDKEALHGLVLLAGCRCVGQRLPHERTARKPLKKVLGPVDMVEVGGGPRHGQKASGSSQLAHQLCSAVISASSQQLSHGQTSTLHVCSVANHVHFHPTMESESHAPTSWRGQGGQSSGQSDRKEEGDQVKELDQVKVTKKKKETRSKSSTRSKGQAPPPEVHKKQGGQRGSCRPRGQKRGSSASSHQPSAQEVVKAKPANPRRSNHLVVSSTKDSRLPSNCSATNVAKRGRIARWARSKQSKLCVQCAPFPMTSSVTP